jgi:hypothetical protein
VAEKRIAGAVQVIGLEIACRYVAGTGRVGVAPPSKYFNG